MTTTADQHNGHHAVHVHVDPRPHLPEGPEALTEAALAPFSRGLGTPWLVVSGIMLLLGVVGVVMRIMGGFQDRAAWGFYAAIFAWVLSTAQAAPLLSVATRLTKGFWRKPLVRAAELFTVSGVLNLLLMLPLLWVIPPVEGRRSFWCAKVADEGACIGPWPWAPQIWIVVGMVALVLCGLGLLYASSRPDVAIVQDRKGQPRHGIAASWLGTPGQWKIMSHSLTYLGIFYLMMLVGMQFMVGVEMAISLVPGWRDPIFPAFLAISSIQAGLGTLLVALGLLRAAGYKTFLALDQFWNPAKLLLSFSLLWFYFWWSGFIIFWYGRTPPEQGVLLTTIFGPYLVPFIIGFVCNFVAPLLLLMWNPIRVSIPGPIIVGVIVIIGNLFDRIRIYAGSFGVTDVTAPYVVNAPVTRMPDLADALVLVGAIGGVVFLYLLAIRFIPPVSLWELKEGQLLTRTRHILNTPVIVIGKPQ